MSDERMNKKHIIPLLLQYKKYPSLWNQQDKNYKNNNNREKILEKILKELKLDMTTGQLRMRIKNLRTTYVREVNKIIESENAGKLFPHKPRLMWFDVADSFLRQVVSPRVVYEYDDDSIYSASEETEPLTTEQPKHSEENTDRFSTFEEPKEEIEEVVVKVEHAESNYEKDTNASSDEDYSPVRSTLTNNIQKNNEQNSMTRHAMSIPANESMSKNQPMPVIYQPSLQEDEFDTFGRHIANQLRSLPLTEAIKSQNHIHNFLSQQRLKVLEGSCSSCIE